MSPVPLPFAHALGAIAVHAHGADTALFGGFSPGEGQATCASWLQTLWGIDRGDDVSAVLDMLSHRGGSAELRAFCERLDADKEGLDPRRRELIEQHRAALGTRSLTAWDTGRIVNVAAWGFLAGYLSREEAYRVVLPAAERAARAYASWEEWATHYLIGRAFWSNADPSVIQASIAWLNTDRASPWRNIAWPILPPLPVEVELPGLSLGERSPIVDEARPLRHLLEELEADLSAVDSRPFDLRPGARGDFLSDLEREFPGTPPDVLELLAWHDGQHRKPASIPTPTVDEVGTLLSWTGTLLNGVQEMLGIGQGQMTFDEERYLPLFGDDPALVTIAVQLTGARKGAVVLLGAARSGFHSLRAPSVRAFLLETIRIARGARLDADALHPGDVDISPSQAFKLALSGCLTVENRGSHTVLTTLRPIVGAGAYLKMLVRWWNVRTRAQLLEKVESLLERASEERATDVAFYIGRAVFLARAGVCTTMLDSREAWRFIGRAASIARAKYDDWEAYSDDYLSGLVSQFPIDASASNATENSAIVLATRIAMERLFAPDGRWSQIPWSTVLEDDLPPPVPASPTFRISPNADQNQLADAMLRARPGDTFELDEGVHPALKTYVSVAVVGRWGASPQQVHLVGYEGAPGVVVGDTTLLARRLMVSASKEIGISVESGQLILDRALINTPAEPGLTLFTNNAIAYLRGVHMGGRGALQLDGSLGLDACTVGQHTGPSTVLCLGGTCFIADTELNLYPASQVYVSGKDTTFRARRVSFQGTLGTSVEVRDGASAYFDHCQFSGGRHGIHAFGSTVSGRFLSFGTGGAAPQLRGAIRLEAATTATLEDITIEGSRSLIAGTSRNGLLLRDPANEGKPETDALPKAAIVVASGSVVGAVQLHVRQRDASAIYVDSSSTAFVTRGRLVGRRPACVVLKGGGLSTQEVRRVALIKRRRGVTGS